MGPVVWEGDELIVSKGGKVTGFTDACRRRVHGNQCKMLANVWEALRVHGQMEEAFHESGHRLADIISYTILFARHRKQHRQPTNGKLQTFFVGLRTALQRWMAPLFERFVLEVYAAAHDTSRPVPSLKHKSGYVSVSPDTIWGWFQQARDAGISLEQVLRVRSHDPEAGCAVSRAEYWCYKYQDMYVRRRAM
eukprot:10672687-Lingulodinium_polyedra.AAC.1